MYFKPILIISIHIEIVKLILFFIICFGICLLLVSIASLISINFIRDQEKLSQYECGFDPLDNDSRKPTEIHFYIIGILFLLFDLEIALLFPYIASIKTEKT